jgi:hypothetical protein
VDVAVAFEQAAPVHVENELTKCNWHTLTPKRTLMAPRVS